MPTFRQLEYLVAIGKTGSFREAADLAGASQPTLSQQIKVLEDHLQVQLLVRGKRRARLTPIGREIFAAAQEVTHQIAAIRRVARLSRHDGLAGTMRWCVSPTIGPYFLSEALPQLHQTYPNLKIHIREGVPDQAIFDLLSGELDLICGALVGHYPAVTCQPLFSEKLTLVAAIDDPLCGQKQVMADDLAGRTIIGVDSHYSIGRTIDELAARSNMRIFRDYVGSNLDGVKQMCAVGVGLALLPETYIRSDAGGIGGVRPLAFDDDNLSREIVLAWRKNAPFADDCAKLASALQAIQAQISSNEPPNT